MGGVGSIPNADGNPARTNSIAATLAVRGKSRNEDRAGDKHAGPAKES
jgi:hypothetical protein